MSLALVYSRAQCGVDAPLVTVEAHLSGGLPALNIVGLPETAVKESKDRVRSAILNSHFEFPQSRITINLAPADLPKEGGRFDLPIALGILAASGQLPASALERCEFLGELALSGALRSVRGALSASLQSEAAGRALLVPVDNAEEAALSRDSEVYAADNLLQVSAHLHGRAPLRRYQPANQWQAPAYPDLAEVQGQHAARRALEIAAAGGHNLLLAGPPGTGKTMLASRLPGILPALSERERLEVAALASVAGKPLASAMAGQRPFRNPHHTASAIALVGGGSKPRPGEVSLAHHGILFLDELPEFPRSVLEVLREPLESGEIVISRALQQLSFPARFQLVAAMNPCPCGYLGDGRRHCRCTPDQIRRYRDRISGPLLDRIDLQVTVPRLPAQTLGSARAGEDSATVRARVAVARERQQQRAGTANAQLEGALLERHCPLPAPARRLLEAASERLGLSTRAYHRIRRVARTIADLADCERIGEEAVAEALSYRQLEAPLQQR